MIVIVDTGGANLASVQNALERLDIHARLTADSSEILSASHVILPGVGAAKDCMARLEALGLVDCLRSLQQPTLGICLGMQVLFEASEEGETACLGVLPGTVRRMAAATGYPVPHMGWNGVVIDRRSALTEGIDSGEYFYFVHSFAAPAGRWVSAFCEYRGPIPAIVNAGNFYGVQFHPERSSAAGSRLLRNFIQL